MSNKDVKEKISKLKEKVRELERRAFASAFEIAEALLIEEREKAKKNLYDNHNIDWRERDGGLKRIDASYKSYITFIQEMAKRSLAEYDKESSECTNNKSGAPAQTQSD